SASLAQIEQVRAQRGLDRPLQFASWSGHVLQGELGNSLFLNQSVASLIGQRLEPTLSLAALTIILTVLIAVPLGVLAAARHGGWLDRALMSFSVLGFSIPTFVIGYLLIWGVALEGGLLPVQGYARLADDVLPWLTHLALPALTLSIIYLALIARVTRAAVAEALTEDYIRTARA